MCTQPRRNTFVNVPLPLLDLLVNLEKTGSDTAMVAMSMTMSDTVD